MSESFFLVHLIDKMGYYGINEIYRIPHDLFKKGRSQYKGDRVYIQGIEPEPEIDNSFEFEMDSKSFWFGVGIIPKETFEENLELYKDLCRWIMDFLYLSRFLINLNLKARVFFHTENYNEEINNSKLSFQRSIELNCSGSIFQVRNNQYHLVLPLLTKLLQYKPTDKLRAIMYNYANSRVGNSGAIDYFFSFATLEGIVQNWAEANGYSQLWGIAVATTTEQDRLHRDLKSHFTEFVKTHDFEGKKKAQLESFINSTFPLRRKIRRSIKQRFKSYYNLRLTDELRENEDMQVLLRNFYRISSRRNEIGHSLETYLRSPRLIKDVNTLMSSIKIIMDFELEKFLNNEIDWKFETRPYNLRENMSQIIRDNLLDKFNYNVVTQNRNDIYLTDRSGTRNVEKIEFCSEMTRQNNNDFTNLIFVQNLKIILPEIVERVPVTGVVNMYKDPYWWLLASQGNSHYIIKSFQPTRASATLNEVRYEILSENILSVAKLESVDIPDDIDIFSLEY